MIPNLAKTLTKCTPLYIIKYKALVYLYNLEDKDNNLWNTYNIIQERMIKGQMYLMNGRGSYISKSRQIKSIDKDIKLNRSLWALTEKMAQIKTA